MRIPRGERAPVALVSAEFRSYVEQARRRPSLLASRLAHVGLGQVCAGLCCDELAALRLLVCEQPALPTWERDVALIAAYTGVDRVRLDRFLHEIGGE